MIPPIAIYAGVSVVASLIGSMISRRRMRELAEQIETIRVETDAAVTKNGTKVVEVGGAVTKLTELVDQIVEQVNWLSAQQGQTAGAINGLIDKVGGVEKLRKAAHAAMPGTFVFNSLGPIDTLKQPDTLTAAGFKPPASGPVDDDDDDDDDGDDETVEDETDWVAKREAVQV